MRNVPKNSIADFSSRYLDVMETLHGTFNLHPAPSIEELCAEWNNQFVAVEDIEAKQSSQAITDWHEPYIVALESIYGPMFIQPDLSIEEINSAWMNLFMTNHNLPTSIQKVA